MRIQSDFLKSIMVLTSGTILAQIVSYLTTPLITRLFTPEEMGELGVFLRLTAFVTAIATARYEVSLPLPKSNFHAFQLFRLSVRISLYTILSVFIIGMAYWIWNSFDVQIFWYVLFVVFASFFLTFRNVGVNWAIRNHTFRQISISSVLGSAVTNGGKIIAGLFNQGVIGLIAASTIGALAAVAVFLKGYFGTKKKVGFKQSKQKMRVLAKQYREFPQVNLPHVLIDNTRELLIAFLVVEFFDKAIFGSYDHSFRMLKLPLVLVGASIGQVFYNRCSLMFSQKEAIYPLLKKTTYTLTALSVLPFGIIFFFGEELFTFVFGAHWTFSGRISEIIAPWLLVNFITSPISTIPLVIGKQKLFFWLGVLNSVIQIAGFGLLPILMNQGLINADQLFYCISLSMCLFNIAVVLVTLKITKKADERNALR
jgi:O-antigen/teichoic acid export membrane protein